MRTPDCLLACGHWVRISLELCAVGAGECCQFCGETVIVKVNRQEYRVRCLFPGCRYGRWFGQDQAGAKAARTRHVDANPTHTATVAWDSVTWDGKGSVFREGPDRTARTKPKPPPKVIRELLDFDPPF